MFKSAKFVIISVIPILLLIAIPKPASAEWYIFLKNNTCESADVYFDFAPGDFSPDALKSKRPDWIFSNKQTMRIHSLSKDVEFQRVGSPDNSEFGLLMEGLNECVYTAKDLFGVTVDATPDEDLIILHRADADSIDSPDKRDIHYSCISREELEKFDVFDPEMHEFGNFPGLAVPDAVDAMQIEDALFFDIKVDLSNDLFFTTSTCLPRFISALEEDGLSADFITVIDTGQARY